MKLNESLYIAKLTGMSNEELGRERLACQRIAFDSKESPQIRQAYKERLAVIGMYRRTLALLNI